MKKSTYLALVALVLTIALLSLAAAQKSQSAEVLLGAALHQEEVEGNFEAAIETYKKILTDFPDNRPIAAKALLQMGRCYEKLGKSGARTAYERLVREYADQSEEAKLARSRLAALLKPPSAGKQPVFATRKVWELPDLGNIEGAPSPDGGSISFTDWETGDLAVRDLETGTSRRLTNKGSWEKSEEFAMFSRWSPDGKQIAYDWYDGRSMDLCVIALEGGDPRTLFDNKHEEWIQTYDWTPDSGQILIFFENDAGQRQIVLVSATDGTTKVVKSFENAGRFPQTMRFSPDGRYIVFDQPQEENTAEHDIFLIPADGGQEVTLVKHPSHDQLLGWPPERSGILFASDRTGSLDMWYLPVSGGDVQGSPELVRTGIEQIVPLGFTQDGCFFYAQGGEMLDAYVARMDRQSGRILAPAEKAIRQFEGANSWPEYSPDGKSLAYVSTRSRAFQAALKPNIVCIRSLETGEEREFPTKFGRLAGTRWSPDGRFLYLAAWDDQSMGIYRVDTRSGEIIPIIRDEYPQKIHSHNISIDGKALIYVRRDQVASKMVFRVLSRDLTTGEEKEIYTAGAEDGRPYISISPDGERLAAINRQKQKTLRLIPTRGGQPRDLLTYEDGRSGFTPLEWTADGKYILFARALSAKDDPRRSLWRISADGGEPQELGLEMANFENLSVHPDGVRLAFCSVGSTLTSPSVWAMENFLPPVPARPAPVTMTARMIENPPGDTPNCRVSPDGRYLTSTDWDKNNVFVRDLQTGKNRQLTDWSAEGDERQGAGGTAAWSYDGKKIAYAWNIRRDRTLIRSELRITGVDGGKPRILAEFKDRDVGRYIWSPDEKYLAATAYPENGSPGIVLISTEDGSVRALTDLKREIWPTNKVFSPDSRQIAYDRLPDENSPERDIYLLSVETGQDIPLVRHPADDYLLGWSRDGKWLVFASDRTGALGLWVVGVSGRKTEGEPKLVKPGIDRILPVGMTRDGALYYGVVRAAEDIFIVDLDPKTGMVVGPPRRAIEQFEGGNFTPAYSPDGKYMAYVSRRGNSPYPTNVGNALCIRSLETGKERFFYKEVWELGLRNIGMPAWSPDGGSIVFRGWGGNSVMGIYRIRLETGKIVRVVTLAPEERSSGGIYGPDGNFYYLRANMKENFSQIVARDLDSGEEQELYRSPKLERTSFALSPDGRWLAFANDGWGGVRSLKIMPASGGEAREIWNFGEMKQGVPPISLTWALDGRYIVFGAPELTDLPTWDLWRVSVEGGRPPEKMGLQKRWGIGDPTVHPDGTKLAYASRGGASDESELWVLENFLPH